MVGRRPGGENGADRAHTETTARFTRRRWWLGFPLKHASFFVQRSAANLIYIIMRELSYCCCRTRRGDLGPARRSCYCCSDENNRSVRLFFFFFLKCTLISPKITLPAGQAVSYDIIAMPFLFLVSLVLSYNTSQQHVARHDTNNNSPPSGGAARKRPESGAERHPSEPFPPPRRVGGAAPGRVRLHRGPRSRHRVSAGEHHTAVVSLDSLLVGFLVGFS